MSHNIVSATESVHVAAIALQWIYTSTHVIKYYIATYTFHDYHMHTTLDKLCMHQG